jgi:hypothetical protein
VATVYRGVLAAVWTALAATYSQRRILYSIQAACFAGLALVNWLDPRTARHQAELMARLQAPITTATRASGIPRPRTRKSLGCPTRHDKIAVPLACH